jgi:hypothetical protein
MRPGYLCLLWRCPAAEPRRAAFGFFRDHDVAILSAVLSFVCYNSYNLMRVVLPILGPENHYFTLTCEVKKNSNSLYAGI